MFLWVQKQKKIFLYEEKNRNDSSIHDHDQQVVSFLFLTWRIKMRTSRKISVMTISHSEGIITSLDFFNVRFWLDILTHFSLMVTFCIFFSFFSISHLSFFFSSSSSSNTNFYFVVVSFIAVIVCSRRRYWWNLFSVLLAYWIFNRHSEIQHSIHINYWKEQFFMRLVDPVCFWEWTGYFLLGSFLHFHSSYYKIFVLSQKIIRKNLYREEMKKFIREWNQQKRSLEYDVLSSLKSLTNHHNWSEEWGLYKNKNANLWLIAIWTNYKKWT